MADEQPRASRHRARWIGLAVWIVLAGLVALFAFGDSSGPDQADSRILGLRVPEVAGPTTDGGVYDIDNARGRWVVVNFFATWCPGCVVEHPELVLFEQQARESGRAELVAIVFNDSSDLVREFFAENGGGWPVIEQPSLAVDFQVAQIPETFIVAPSGVVTHRFQGEVTAELLWAAIDAANQS